MCDEQLQHSNNGTDDTDYLTSIQARGSSGTGNYRNGAPTGTSYADFSEASAHYTSYSQGGAGGSYTVREGDSLASIAAQPWGDAGLWYKLAQANGMSADGALAAGQSLIVPSGVGKSDIAQHWLNTPCDGWRRPCVSSGVRGRSGDSNQFGPSMSHAASFPQFI